MIALETLGRFGPLERLELYFERHLERRLDAVLLQQVHNHLSQPVCLGSQTACTNIIAHCGIHWGCCTPRCCQLAVEADAAACDCCYGY
jgi:hypothetical protein